MLRVIVVVARDRPELLSYFETVFAGMPDIKVLLDRRLAPPGADPAAPPRAADAVVRGAGAARAGPTSRPALSRSSTRARAWRATTSPLALTATSRSEGVPSGASAGHIAASASIARPVGVPITTATSVTPASCRVCSATRMRSMESKYEFGLIFHDRCTLSPPLAAVSIVAL